MNFNPESFQQNMEIIPTVNPEAHFILNDISLAVLNQEEILEEHYDLLNEVIIQLQPLDRDFVSYMQSFEEVGILLPDQINILCGYILVSRQIGPDVEIIRNMLYNQTATEKEFSQKLNDVSIPEHTRYIINDVYKVLLNNKKSA